MVYDKEDVTTDERKVRLLINDVGEQQIFSDEEIAAFLALEGSQVKLAAAQALDTIADDEALTSKVIKDHDLQTDGAKTADSLRKRAESLRAQWERDQARADDGFFLDVIPYGEPCPPELVDS